jgi:WD40 repeat protein/serine/threonine protein kinase
MNLFDKLRKPKSRPQARQEDSPLGEHDSPLRHGGKNIVFKPRSRPEARVSPPTELTNFSDAERVPSVWKVADIILDRYEVKQVFTGGGMGLVYRVHHRDWNIELAVKSPRPEFFQSQHQIENFEREADTWVNLGLHPHIVSCYYVRRLGGIPRLFAEFLDGGSLADWIRTRKLYEGGPDKTLERILDIALQFALGLCYAHEQGLVHRDVKPGNVLMNTEGAVKVTDFGLAKARALTGETTNSTGESILISSGGMTPAYCSPEQADGKPLSSKTDIWSWAISVFEMFFGEPPCRYGGRLAPEVFESYLRSDPEDQTLPPMPASLIQLLRGCFQSVPSERPANFTAIIADLKNAYLDVTGIAYSREQPMPVEMLADGLNNQALSLIDLGRQKEGERVMAEGLRKHPGHIQLTYNYGLVLWRSARLTDAVLLTQLEEAHKTHPEDGVAAYYMGLVHLERLDVESAIEKLEEAMIFDGHVAIRETLKRARSMLPSAARCLRTVTDNHFVNACCVSTDNRFALSGGDAKTLCLWELATGRVVRTFYGHDYWIKSVCFSKDNRWALSGSCDKTLRLWEVATGDCVRIFKGHTGIVTSVYLSNDAQWALSASHDTTLRLWEVSTGRCVRTFEGHPGAVISVCLTRNERWALSGGAMSSLCLWDVRTERCVREFEGVDSNVWAVSFAVGDRYAIAGHVDGELTLWEVATGRRVRTFQGHTGPVTSVAVSPTASIALSGSDDGTVRVWEVGTGRCLRTFAEHGIPWRRHVTSVCLAPDGVRALSGGEDQVTRVWQLGALSDATRQLPAPTILCKVESAKETRRSKEQFDQLLTNAQTAMAAGRYAAALPLIREARSFPGRRFASKALDLWNLAGRHATRQAFQAAWCVAVLKGHTNLITSAYLDGVGKYALSGSYDTTLRLWEASTGQCIRTFNGHAEAVTAGVISSDGCRILSGSYDETIRLWDATTGECLQIFESPKDGAGRKGVTCVYLSEDGRWALSGGLDSTVRLWEVSTGRCVRTLTGHTWQVNSVLLGGGAKWALSASHDGTVRLWDVSAGQCTKVFQRHGQLVNSVAKSLNEEWAVSTSADRTVRLWHIATGTCLRIFTGHTNFVTTAVLGWDWRWIISGSWDKTIRIWETETGNCIRVLEGHEGTIDSVCMSANGRWVISASRDQTLRLWELDWEFEPHETVDWDEDARSLLANFLTRHTPYAALLPKDREPTDEEIRRALTREGKPVWAEGDFCNLIDMLACAGYGWLRPEGVRRELASELAVVRTNNANAVGDSGDVWGAVDLYDRPIKILERLVNVEGRRELSNILASIYADKAIAFMKLGDNPAALASYDRAIEIFKRLVNIEGRREFAEELERLEALHQITSIPGFSFGSSSAKSKALT